MSNNTFIQKLVENIVGTFALGTETEIRANQAYNMGLDYSKTKRFDNSRHYHNYQFRLNDGNTVLSSNYFNLFTSRNQTAAYMDAEQHVKALLGHDDQRLFHLVRDKRIDINGVFKAIMSPAEPQQLNYSDYVLIIACFCTGALEIPSISLSQI